MLAGYLASRHYTPSRSDLLTICSSEGGQCQPVTQHPGITLRPSVRFTYHLQQRRRAVLDGYSAPRHYSPFRFDSLTSYSSEEGQC